MISEDMSTPEKIIAAFLQVWETNPDDIFTTSGAINGLPELSSYVVGHPEKSNADIAKKIQEWSRNYKQLRDVLVAALRKPKNKPTDPTKQGNVVGNNYPELYASLCKRIEQSGK